MPFIKLEVTTLNRGAGWAAHRLAAHGEALEPLRADERVYGARRVGRDGTARAGRQALTCVGSKPFWLERANASWSPGSVYFLVLLVLSLKIFS